TYSEILIAFIVQSVGCLRSRALEMAPTRPQFDKMQEKTVQPQETDKPLEQQLAEAHAKAESNREVMLRALADAENARKRFQAEAANAQKYALERFAETLLPVMDSLEAALANPEASSQALRDGVHLTLRSSRRRSKRRASC